MWPGLTGRQGELEAHLIARTRLLSAVHTPTCPHTPSTGMCDDGMDGLQGGALLAAGVPYYWQDAYARRKGTADGPVRAIRAAQDSDAVVWSLRFGRETHLPEPGSGPGLGRPADWVRGNDLAFSVESTVTWTPSYGWRFSFRRDRLGWMVWYWSGCWGWDETKNSTILALVVPG